METYRVAHMPHVVKQMRDLAKKAAQLGIKAELIAAFESLNNQLQSSPFGLGNPVHRTRKQGGVVLCRDLEPASVRFAVFEDEQAVFLLDVKPITRFFFSVSSKYSGSARCPGACCANAVEQLAPEVRAKYISRVTKG
jgi:hypothetical protein